MTRSEFQRAVEGEFGALHGATLCRDLILGELNDRSANDALENGTPPARVWQALCVAMDVPASRRHGAGIADPPAVPPL